MMNDFKRTREYQCYQDGYSWHAGTQWVECESLKNRSLASVTARLTFSDADHSGNFIKSLWRQNSVDFIIDTTRNSTFITNQLAEKLKLTSSKKMLEAARPREYAGRHPFCGESTLYFTLAKMSIPVNVYFPIDPEADLYVRPLLGVAALLTQRHMMMAASRTDVCFFQRRLNQVGW